MDYDLAAGLVKILVGLVLLAWTWHGGVDRMLTPLRALVRDAYRYRWLRAQHQNDQIAAAMFVAGGDGYYVGHNLDAAIDVAMDLTPNTNVTGLAPEGD